MVILKWVCPATYGFVCYANRQLGIPMTKNLVNSRSLCCTCNKFPKHHPFIQQSAEQVESLHSYSFVVLTMLHFSATVEWHERTQTSSDDDGAGLAAIVHSLAECGWSVLAAFDKLACHLLTRIGRCLWSRPTDRISSAPPAFLIAQTLHYLQSKLERPCLITVQENKWQVHRHRSWPPRFQGLRFWCQEC